MTLRHDQPTTPAEDFESARLNAAPMTRERITAELDAVARGELRSKNQIVELYNQLGNVDTHHRALSERLGLGHLVEERPLEFTPTLLIQIDPDLRWLKYGEITEDISVQDLNPRNQSGRLFAKDLHFKHLITVPNPTLISPSLNALVKNGSLADGDRVMQMIRLNDRLTFLGDIPATWNGTLEPKVWSTNIDTVNFVKWLRLEGVFNHEIHRSAEIGVGIGGISQALLHDNPAIEHHVITDISAEALNATIRNLRPYISEDRLTWYLGKGVRTLDHQGSYDLIITNPPYIPHPEGHDAVDPYRGTGLIRELFERAPFLLNRDNPNAAIYIQLSNLSMNDLARYQKEFPDIEVTAVGQETEVPLKIWGVSREEAWIEFLKSQGLIDRPDLAETTGLRYYHRISAIRLRPKTWPSLNE